MLRDLSQLDIEYPLRDLVIHVFDLLEYTKHIVIESTDQESIGDFMIEVLELFAQEDATTDTPTKFRQLVNNQFIVNKDFVLKNLKQGLTLNGKGLQ